MTATRYLSRRDVASLLTVEVCIPALEEAFSRQAQGSDLPPAILGLHTALGAFTSAAAALLVYRKAVERDLGLWISGGSPDRHCDGEGD
ncbi:MAG: hypothetical protein ACREKS_04045 [Candidatus Rokuibacteriota bacterium]